MDTRSAVELYFKGLETGNVSQIPLAEQVRFVGPTLPEGVQDEVRELLANDDCFRVVEGKIVEVQPFYDPRPLIGS